VEASVIVNLTADGAVACTPSNTTNDPKGPFVGLLIVNGGTVTFVDAAGNTVGPTDSLPAGTEIHVKVVRVNSTGTSATVAGLIGVA
jgi:hypothetical protein